MNEENNNYIYDFNKMDLKTIFNLNTNEENDLLFVIPNNSKYIILAKKEVQNILFQISDIVLLNSKNREEQGITIRKIDDSKIEIIYPNQSCYFKTVIPVKNNLETGDILYFDYLFLKKIIKHLPSEIIVFTKSERVKNEVITNYYLRVGNADLILPYIYLSNEEISRLDINCEILNDGIEKLNKEEMMSKLTIMNNFISLESDTTKRELYIYNRIGIKSLMSFTSYTELNLPNIKLNSKIIKYLIKSCLLSKDEAIMILPTKSEYHRYAIKYENTLMIFVCIPTTKEHTHTKELINKPFLSVIDAKNLKNKLDIKHCCYSLPSLYLKFVDGQLQMSYQLVNGMVKNYKIDTINSSCYFQNIAIRLSSETLFRILEIFNYKKITKIGYKKDNLFLENSKVVVVLKNLN